MNKVPMTKLGSELLTEELKRLKFEDRPAVVKAIAEARAHGDLKENAEYHAAREQQGFIEGRIKDIEAKMSNCQVIDVTTMDNEGKVIFGSTVVLMDANTDEEMTYTIVGEDEADFTIGKISYSSPIARGLMAKMEGDEVQVQTPGGLVEYEVVEVKYI